MERFTKTGVLGEGTYGKVLKAIDNETGKVVAIKQVRVNKATEGVHVTALREIKILKELHHPNILNLIQVIYHKNSLHLVCDYMASDLEMIIKDRRCRLNAADVKAYMQMTLKAVAHLHKNWVLHRDLKPNNLLISTDGSLQLADFGLSRIFGSPERKWTSQVYQLWYRPPELLFGCEKYSELVDMWAVGCILAELLLRRPLFKGSGDMDQLSKIFNLLGTPSEEQWRGMRCFPTFITFPPAPPQDLKTTFPQASEDALHLLSKLLVLDPNQRLTAEEALKHRYFRSSPPPTPPHLLPKPPANSASTDSGAHPVISRPASPWTIKFLAQQQSQASKDIFGNIDTSSELQGKRKFEHIEDEENCGKNE